MICITMAYTISIPSPMGTLCRILQTFELTFLEQRFFTILGVIVISKDGLKIGLLAKLGNVAIYF